jgi:glycosyltransferase involved in cell wall biosynthesis
MYCGACARDVGFILGLRARGHDVQVVPLYTPLRVEHGQTFSVDPVFLGGINLSLQQRSSLFRRLPPALDRILDNTALLRFVSRFAINTRAAELGEMTVAVLAGPAGPFRKECDRLLIHLDRQAPPDAIVITNTMLSGLAPALKQRYGVPIICQVQGEDGFVGAMAEPHRSQAETLIRRNVQAVDLFVAPNENYAAEMAGYLGVPPPVMRVVRTGLQADAYRHDQPRPRDPFCIGYLSGIAHGKGLDLLVEAWRQLGADPPRSARLLVAGRVLDTRYWKSVLQQVDKAGLGEQFEYVGEVTLGEKRRFLQRCSAFSLPSRQVEPRGLAAMEAMAAGVPVVVPDSGVFPELLSLTGGGLLFRPSDPADLASKVAELMDEPERADGIGRRGAEGIVKHYPPDLATDGFVQVLEEALAKGARGS